MGRWLGANVSYNTAHARCHTQWGKASGYPCVQCEAPARDWAYDGTDPEQLWGPNRVNRDKHWHYYSAWPEFYMPMCVPCHRKKDRADCTRDLFEYREWMHRTGKRLVNCG